MHHLLHDIGIAIILATVMGLTAQFLRQPVILGYLVAGAVAGPLGFGWVQDSANIGIISEIGLILLLFVIGLEMNLTELKTSGRALLVAGLGQFPLCVLIALPAFALIGVLLGSVGTDVNSGAARFTMDLPFLMDGIGLISIALGCFQI